MNATVFITVLIVEPIYHGGFGSLRESPNIKHMVIHMQGPT